MENRIFTSRKRIAMEAHDKKKKEILDWAAFNKTVLARHELMATGTTGRLLEDQLDRPVKKPLSAPWVETSRLGPGLRRIEK